MNKEEKEKLVNSYPDWWHSIDFGDGVISKGKKGGAGHTANSHNLLQDEVKKWFPEDFFAGKRVLDVGAWDGFYSFHAEKSGAKEVVAIDELVWQRQSSDKKHTVKRGFDIAKKILNSKVKEYFQDITEPCVDLLGTFDSIIFAGVIYHLRHPMKSVEVLDTLVRKDGRIMVETHTLNNDIAKPIMQFHPKNSLAGDWTNFWSPNIPCVIGMFNEVGSYKVERQGTSGDRAYMVLRKQ